MKPLTIQNMSFVIAVCCVLLLSSLVFIPNFAFAQDANPSLGSIQTITKAFTEGGHNLYNQFRDVALSIFYALMTISMVWTFGQMALKKADLAEFVSEFVKFCMFFGFFLVLLNNAPSIVNYIEKFITGLANPDPSMSTPVNIVQQGFDTWANIMNGMYATPIDRDKSFFGQVGDFFSGIWDSVAMIPTNIVLMFISIGVLIVHLILAVDLLIMQISLIMLAYVGMFLLGFGGSRWTSEIAINYYKTVLGQAVQMLVLLLVCKFCAGVMHVLIADIQRKGATAGLTEAMQVLVGALLIYFLGKKLPPLISGIISSASGGSTSVSGGAGAALAGMAGAVAMGSAMGVAKMAGMQSVTGKDGGTNSPLLQALGISNAEYKTEKEKQKASERKQQARESLKKPPKPPSSNEGSISSSEQQTPLADANK